MRGLYEHSLIVLIRAALYEAYMGFRRLEASHTGGVLVVHSSTSSVSCSIPTQEMQEPWVMENDRENDLQGKARATTPQTRKLAAFSWKPDASSAKNLCSS